MKKCRGCAFYKALAGGYSGSGKACHHLLLTGSRRTVGADGACLSFRKDGQESRAYIESLSKQRQSESLSELL